jgi:hypothetical protein
LVEGGWKEQEENNDDDDQTDDENSVESENLEVDERDDL